MASSIPSTRTGTRSRDIPLHGGLLGLSSRTGYVFRRVREGLKRGRYAADDEFRDQPNLGNHSRYIWGEHRPPPAARSGRLLLRLNLLFFFFFFTISGHVAWTARRAKAHFRKRTVARAHTLSYFNSLPPDDPTNYTNASVRRNVLWGGGGEVGAKEESLESGTFVHGKIGLQSFLLRACLMHRVGNCMHGPSRPRDVGHRHLHQCYILFSAFNFCRDPSHERGSRSPSSTPRPSAAPCQNRDPRSSPTEGGYVQKRIAPSPNPTW